MEASHRVYQDLECRSFRCSAGVGNQTQLLAELFRLRSGIDVVHVPYKSGNEMVTAVLSQQVQMAFPDISNLIPLIREGKLKALAVTRATRHLKSALTIV